MTISPGNALFVLYHDKFVNWKNEYMKVVVETCKRFEMPPEFVQQISIEWNTTTTRVMGCAMFRTNEIELSVQLFHSANDAQRLETVVHEICHLIAYYKFRDNGHGNYWAHCMITCGYKPERCHRVVAESALVSAKCRCAAEKKISRNRAARIRNGTGAYYCGRCGTNLTVA